MTTSTAKKYTTPNGFRFWQDWDEHDGMLSWEGAKTMTLYCELEDNRTQIDLTAYDMFAAYTDKQFKDGIASIRPLGEGEKLIDYGCGVFGTRDGIAKYEQYCIAIKKRIAEECDPQEIYCYEFNNHESMSAYDGDMDAVLIVAHLFGWSVCRRLKRFSPCWSLSELQTGEYMM